MSSTGFGGGVEREIIRVDEPPVGEVFCGESDTDMATFVGWVNGLIEIVVDTLKGVTCARPHF